MPKSLPPPPQKKILCIRLNLIPATGATKKNHFRLNLDGKPDQRWIRVGGGAQGEHIDGVAINLQG